MLQRVPQIIFYWIVLVAVTLRLNRISGRSLWFDEALSWKLQSFSMGLMLQRTGEPTTTHPPLYFLMLHLWTDCFGDSETAMRSLSAVLGVALILAMHKLIRSLGSLSGTLNGTDDERTVTAAVLACGFLAISNLHIHQSQQVRGYTLAALLTVVSSVFLVRAISHLGNTRIQWCGYIGSVVALCYTHNLGLFSVFAQGVFAGLYLWMPGAAARGPSVAWGGGSPDVESVRRLRQTRISFVVAVAVAAVAYLPWLTRSLGQSQKLRSSWTRPLTLDTVAIEIENALTGTSTESFTFPSTFSWAVLIGLVLLWSLLVLRGGWPGLFLAILGAVPCGLIGAYSLYSQRSIFDARYLMFAQVAWLAAAAWLLSRIHSRRLRVGLAMLSMSGCAYFCWDIQSSHAALSNPGMRDALGHVLEYRQEDEIVIAATPFVFFGSQYYARNHCQVQVAARKKDRFSLNGESQLLTSDLVTPKEVSTRDPPGIWIVTSASYMDNSKSQFPPNCVVPREAWRLVEAREFQQDFFWEDAVEVRHYRRRGGY